MLRQVRDGSGRGGRQVVGCEPQEPEAHELDGEAESAVVAASGLHQVEVGAREREGRQQVACRNVGREAVQTVSIRVRQGADGHRRVPHV